MASTADVLYAYRVVRAERRCDELMAFPDEMPDGSEWPDDVVRVFERHLEAAFKKRDKLRNWGHTGRSRGCRAWWELKPTVTWVDVQ